MAESGQDRCEQQRSAWACCCRDSDGRAFDTEWTLIGNQQCKSELDEANGGGGGAPICATAHQQPHVSLYEYPRLPTHLMPSLLVLLGLHRRLD